MFLVDSARAASDWDGINGAIKKILEKAKAEVVSMRKWDDREDEVIEQNDQQEDSEVEQDQIFDEAEASEDIERAQETENVEETVQAEGVEPEEPQESKPKVTSED